MGPRILRNSCILTHNFDSRIKIIGVVMHLILSSKYHWTHQDFRIQNPKILTLKSSFFIRKKSKQINNISTSDLNRK